MKHRQGIKIAIVSIFVAAIMAISGWTCAATKDTAKDVVVKEVLSKPDKAEPTVGGGYQIGPGDVLSISVWKNPDLTRVVQVLPDGNISFPLLGEIPVKDMTVNQLIKTLSEKLEPYSPDAEISVEVQRTNSMVVYVVGRVNRAGRFEYNDNIDVLQALAMAGGLTPFAKRSDIKVFRTEKDGKKVFTFDYDAVTENNALQQNILLKRGDVVVVP